MLCMHARAHAHVVVHLVRIVHAHVMYNSTHTLHTPNADPQVHTRTLAWLRCSWTPAEGFTLDATEGVRCAPSPDALLLDPGASGLTPVGDAPSSSWTRALTCTCGLATGAAVATMGAAARPPQVGVAVVAATSMGSAVAVVLGTILGARPPDARVVATARRAAVTLAVAAAAAGAMACIGVGRLHRALVLTNRIGAAHATVVFATVATTELMTALGYRASLRASPSPVGLWLPRISHVPSARVAAGK